MKKLLKKLFLCTVVLIAIFSLSQITAFAEYEVSTTTCSMDNNNDYQESDFTMPKDGKVKVNISITDKDSIPGILKVSFRKADDEDRAIVQVFTGITASSPITDAIVDLDAGNYYVSYVLSNASGERTNTAISLTCTIEILPTEVTNISELKVNAINSLDEITDKGYSELQFGDFEKDKSIVIPFTVNRKGGIYISMKPSYEFFNEIKGTIYKDKECTQAIGKSFSLNDMDDSKDYLRSLPSGGTYYINFILKNDEIIHEVEETPFQVKLYEINGEDRSITSGKSTLVYQEITDKKINFKFVVKAASVLAIDLGTADNSKSGSASFCLLDKDKKAITKTSTLHSDLKEDGDGYDMMVKYYTVAAGSYYIQVSASDNLYELVSYVNKYKSNAGLNKAKAKSIRVQGTYGTGYLTTADKTSKTEWYKFTISSRQYVQIELKFLLDGKFDYEVIDSKGTILSKEIVSKEGSWLLLLENYYDKGTYYIKVNKVGTTSSLAYILNLNNYENSVN